MSRDDLLARLASRLPGGDRPRPQRRTGRRIGAVVLGWLVLMTIWGFGRAWHGGLAPVELALGLLAGVVAAVVAWPRERRPPNDRDPGEPDGS